jgi:hypothetical protein
MPELADLIHFTPPIMVTVLRQFRWYIHPTPDRNLGGIRQNGILANRDATPSR